MQMSNDEEITKELTNKNQTDLKPIKPDFEHIDDTFKDYSTKALLVGDTINDYYKNIIFNVIQFYNNMPTEYENDTKNKIIKYLHKVFTDDGLNYDKLMKYFQSTTNECLLAYMLIAYNNVNTDLILRCLYTFGRVLPMEYKTEWFDNYRLNNYGNPLNMVMWKHFDCDDIYTITEEPKPINKDVKLDFARTAKFLVGSLRDFIVSNNMYPTNKANYDIQRKTDYINKVRSEYKTKRSQEMMNKQMRKNVLSLYKSDEDIDYKNKTVKTKQSKQLNKLSKQQNKPVKLENTQTVIKKYNQQTNQLIKQQDKLTKSIEQIDTSNTTSTKPTEQTDKQTNTTNSTNQPNEQSNDSSYYQDYKINGGDKIHKTYEQICDECYLHYPFFFGGAHGCDVFDIPKMSLNIEEIKQFLKRYPSAYVGYILNTKTYASKQGEHWVALVFHNGSAKLVCSQQSDFSVFKDDGKLNRALQENGFGQEYNSTVMQLDECNCGLYSALSLYEMLCNGADISKSVNAIGLNAANLKNGFDIYQFRAKLAGTLSDKDMNEINKDRVVENDENDNKANYSNN